jgi:PadR family transcriptional regulator, regulatory protein PadR
MGRRKRSLSLPAIKLLSLMLEDPTADYYGLDLSKRAGLLTGTVYPLLKRLEDMGWLESHQESIDASAEGRPARRLYRLTGDGARQAAVEIEGLQSTLARARPTLGLT